MEISKEGTLVIKGIAIMFMLWHHLFLDTLDFGIFPNQLAIIMKVCVAMFLFVSGYGLSVQYAKHEYQTFRGTIRFLLIRLSKFFLSYWFCMIIVLVVGHISGYTIFDRYPSSRNTLKCLLLDVFGQMGYASYLSTWWFNKLILQLYLIFPILFLLLKNRLTMFLGLLGIACVQQFVPCRVFCIEEGGLFAFYLGIISSAIHPTTSHRRATSIIASSLTILTLVFIRLKFSYINYMIIDGLIAMVIAFFISSTIKNHTFPITSYIGKYATIMYLSHTLLQIIFQPILYSTNYAIINYLIFLSISLSAAILIDKLQDLSRYKMIAQYVTKQINSSRYLNPTIT